MNPIQLILLLLLVNAAGDPVVEVRKDYTQAEWPQQILVYQPAGTTPGAFGLPVSSDAYFEKAAGKKPTLHVFPADWDGNGTDEIVTVRAQQVKTELDLRLRVFMPPLTLGGDTGKPLATSKKKTLGSPQGEGNIFLVGAIELNGNGKDRAFVIRQWADGHQSIELRKFPKKVNKKMKAAFASDETFGFATVDGNVAACGADTDGDGKDEIVVLRRPVGGPDQLLVFRPPSILGDETGNPIVSDLDITAADGAENIGIGRIDIDGDGTDELAVRRLHSATGQRLEIFSFPAVAGGEIGTALFTHPTLAPLGASYGEVAIFGLRGYTAVPPKPPADLSGTYQASMSHSADSIPEIMPPLGDLSAPPSSPGVFSVVLPTFYPLVGSYSQKDAQIDFGAALNKLKVVSTGDLYWLNFGVATVTVEYGKVVIRGTYTGTKDPVMGPTKTVTGGVYAFTRK